VQSLGTKWGLLGHYWVIVKLAITVLATAILLLHTQAIRTMAKAATTTAVLGPEDLVRLRMQLLVDAALAIVALVITTVLAVYKPRGRTRYAAA
jgi:hypothetical protein